MKTRIVQKQFKRKETKYIVNMDVFVEFEKELRQHMTEDEFATSTITNIYFDNEDFDMIQDSLAKNNGREKFVCVCMMKFHQKQVKPFGNQEKGK